MVGPNMADPTGSAMSRSSARSRSAAASLPGEQLSLAACLDPADVRQGSLFAGLEPAADPAPADAQDEPASDDDAMDADSLERAARARPRSRRAGTLSAGLDPRADAAGLDPAGEGEASGDRTAEETTSTAAAAGGEADELPRWHHHSLVDPVALTPVLRHYVELKAAHPERVLLYRLGDFYEFFFEDAILLSRLLELTLTGKEAGKAIGRVPMAGIPYHAAERYCAELVRQGLSVALCDQLESTPAKGALLRRDITRVLTPGTVLEEGMLAARRNNWLCAVVFHGPEGRGPRRWGLAVADISTGEFRVSEREGEQTLHQELLRLEAAEVIWPEPHPGAEGGTTGSTELAAPACQLE